MRKMIILTICLTASLFALAQPDPHEIIVREAGTLGSIITKNSMEQADWLKITGELNSSDIKTLRHMLGGIYYSPSEPREGNLRRLDLTNARIVEGGDPYLCVITANGPDVPMLYTSDNTISYEMFWNCENLEEIRLPVSATRIESESFMYSTSLKSVTIPEGVSRLEGYDFCHCHALESVSLPSTVTELGGYVVDNCPSLKTLACAATEPPVCTEESFSGVEGVTLYVPVGSSGKYRESTGWNKFGTITEVDPMAVHVEQPGTLDSLVSVLSLRGAERMKISGELNGSDIRTLRYLLGGYFTIVFDTQRWGKLRELDLSDASIVSGGSGYFLMDWMSVISVEEAILFTSDNTIGDLMFFDCPNLSAMSLPRSTSSMGPAVFWNCTSLRSLEVPEGVIRLEDEMFNRCLSLEQVFLPSTMRELGNGVVNDCPSLKTFICVAAEPPVCTEETFGEMSGVTLYVPIGSAGKYQQSTGWSKFGTIIEVDVSGINEANASAVKAAGVIHDLQGRHLPSPPDKGVYILDGKKYVK